MNIKGAIFDLDGTLLDSAQIWHEIDIEFLKKRGIDVPADYSRAISHMNFRDTAAYTINRFSLSETQEQVVREWTEMSIDKYRNTVCLKPNALKYLNRLKSKGVKLSTATSVIPQLYEPALRRNKIYELFDSHTFTHESGKDKSSPDVYLLAAERLSLKPYECAVFEDIPAGIKAAKSAGFYTVGVYDFENENKIDEIKLYADKFIFGYQELI